jgi:threonine dehydrogenase-like Zn-dependent dehydrogenase
MYHAASLIKPKQIQIQKREDFKLQANEVLIRMAFAGVCGTDIALYSGDYPISLPRVLGHEVSGIVEKVGSSDYNHLRDKPVVVEINNTCVAYRLPNLCPTCQRGLINHCMTRTVLGIINYDGGFAEYVKVPIGNVHPLSPKINLQMGVFVEPVAAAFRTFEMSPVQKGDTVVILGIGTIGTINLCGGKRVWSESDCRCPKRKRRLNKLKNSVRILCFVRKRMTF